MMKPTTIITIATLALLAAIPTAADEMAIPDEWLTKAEKSGFTATSDFDETVAFLRQAVAASPHIKLDYLGRTGAGRLLPLVVVSKDGLFSPDEARASGQPILLFQSCIHAGEVDGKDASQMILRDMAIGRRPIPEHTIVLFAPIFNADGHEMVSIYNRANQNGPAEGMGFRATANGLNLNRDHMRAASVEMRSLLDLFNRWRPHLHVDNHVTNGSDHGWVLTWMVAEHPTIAPGLDGWLERHLGEAVASIEESGHPAGPYVSLRDSYDPSQGFEWLAISPRFSTDYFPLRNRPSILVEMHAHKPFQQRVLANRDFLLALIDTVEKDPESLVKAVAEAEAATVAQGEPDAEPSEIVLRWRPSGASETIVWPAAKWRLEESVVRGEPMIRFRQGVYNDIRVEWYHGHEPDLVLPRPRGYLVLPGWPQIERLVSDHGLVAHRIPEPIEADVETIRVADPVLVGYPYQGTVPLDDFTTTRQTESRKIPAGAVWIPADQPDFEVAVQLFEPEAPDSMIRWGMLNAVFERKEYIGSQTLEELAKAMLEDDSIRAEWEAALTDETFAADTLQRYLWWYRRTPYWDESVGLVPVFRVMEIPPFVPGHRLP